MRITKVNQLLLVALAVALAAGCSTKASGKRIDYDSARTLPPLEIPPDLNSLPPDTQTSTTAGSSSAATYSKFEQEQQRQATGTKDGKILPEYEKIKLIRAGAQRWLVIDSSAEDLWPQVLDFLDKMGLSIAKQQPDLGVIETNWAENRANVAGTGVQRFFNKITGQGYGTGLRDKYRVRLERGQQPDTTEVYLTHRGLVQVVDESAGIDLTQRELGGPLKWQPRPSDPELEAEMLRRLMVHLGVNMKQADTVLKEKTRAHAHLEGGARRPTLTVMDDLDVAWRRVGVTLDSLGFYVVDEDRDERIYFVHDVNKVKKKRKRKKKDDEEDQYRVALRETAEGVAVEISDIDGTPVRAKATEEILSLLYEQLK